MKTDWNLIDARELAARVQVSVRTVRNWQRDGVVPYIKISARLVRFHPSSVAEALTRFQQNGRPAVGKPAAALAHKNPCKP